MADVLKRVQDARVWLSARIPFLGFLSTRLRPRLATPEDGVPTAGVAFDGTLILNEAWVAGLNDPELRFLLAHEVLHPALEVFRRMGTRNKRLFNVAHDHVINLILTTFSQDLANQITFIEGACRDEKYAGVAAEEIYDLLLKEGKKRDIGGTGDDLRDDLAETVEGQAARAGDQAAERALQRVWRGAAEAGRQLHEAQFGRGSLPVILAQLLDEIKDPKVPWSVVLSTWIGENAVRGDHTYMKPSRRSESAGVLLPGLQKTGFPEVTVLWDTSGSMNGSAGEILSEVAAIVDELGLTARLIVCDSAIHADVQGLTTAAEILPHILGGGGSDFTPAFERLQGEGSSGVVVAFTDGYIGAPPTQPECLRGVLWVITESGVRPCPWGAAIKLTKDGYAEDV